MTGETAITQYAQNPQGLLQYVKQTGDFGRYFEFLKFLRKVDETLDKTLDTVLTGGYELWKSEEQDGEDFYNAVYRVTEMSPEVIKRHIKVGKMLEVAPEEFRPLLEEKDFKQKIYPANLIDQGYEISHEQWKEFAEGNSYQDAAEVAAKVTGAEHRSNWMKWTVDEDFETTGIIYVETSEGRFPHIRVERSAHYAIQPLLDRATKRFLSKLGVTPKVRY